MSEFIDWLPPGVGSPVRQASLLTLFSLSLARFLSLPPSCSPSLPPVFLSLCLSPPLILSHAIKLLVPRLLLRFSSPTSSSSTSNVATSFHPRKLPQVLYLLCLATLVSIHKHAKLFLSLSLSLYLLSSVCSFVHAPHVGVLILSPIFAGTLCPSSPRLLLLLLLHLCAWLLLLEDPRFEPPRVHVAVKLVYVYMCVCVCVYARSLRTKLRTVGIVYRGISTLFARSPLSIPRRASINLLA